MCLLGMLTALFLDANKALSREPHPITPSGEYACAVIELWTCICLSGFLFAIMLEVFYRQVFCSIYLYNFYKLIAMTIKIY